MGSRKYGFYAGNPSEIGFEDLHGNLVAAFGAPTSVSSSGQATNSWLNVLSPDLVVVRNNNTDQTLPWSAYDSACMAVFAGEQLVQHFTVKYPGYQRLTATLLMARAALHNVDADAIAAANRAGRQISSIACQADRTQQLPAGDVGLLLGVAGAARATAWNDHGQRAPLYVQDALNGAAQVNPHFPSRLTLWFDSHIRTRLHEPPRPAI